MKRDLIKIKANQLICTLERNREGISLCSVRDKKKNKNLLSYSRPIFTLTARSLLNDETIEVSSDKDWKCCKIECTDGLTRIILWNNTKLKNVRVIIDALASDNKITWKTELVSDNEEYSLFSCDYPIMTLDSGRNNLFLSPYGCGEVWETVKECSSLQSYPSYGASMQFMAFWNKAAKRGIYYGIHDPAPAYKKIFFQKNKDEKYFTFKASQPLTNINSPKNSQKLFGECVWQIFDGNWYDAAMLYREFFLNQASWKPETDENGRTDTPQWMKTKTHWWRVRMKNDESYVDAILNANKDLGYDTAVHLYDWFKIPYDNDYPHYFPAKDAFYSGVKRLQENGVKVVPYINGRLWDTRDRGMEDYQWSQLAKPNCTKDRKGEPFIETYASKEEDGSPVRHSIMCPSTELWQNKVNELVSKLLNDVGVDGVYIDQIGAASPYLCEDEAHPHLPGGGSWWVEGYNKMLQRIKESSPAETCIATECTADPFMKHIQAYLTWLWVHNNQVPAFVAVYSVFVTMYGRNYHYMPDDDDQGQRITIAQSFTFGEELGWDMPELYMQMKHKDFYKKCVHEREKIGSYMYNGRLLRSPEFTDDQKALFTNRSKEAYGGILRHSAVFCQHWQRNDGESIVVIVNASENTAKVNFKGGLSDGKYKLSGDTQGILEIYNGKGEATLPPLSVVYAQANQQTEMFE